MNASAEDTSTILKRCWHQLFLRSSNKITPVESSKIIPVDSGKIKTVGFLFLGMVDDPEGM
ncbi:hypothetical protein SLEP1_g50922 [Rubroshorea leprosula]|uniref:Uncharacterized protein n=1 Tax=Rubroshorea leprosula TaxID=152421 RepID=A0AAV5M1J3_9ROSI|nr:hypothetical protein SLEP1_g50922 [Rubroshorea leprosula]